jgi:hypothetical protein
MRYPYPQTQIKGQKMAELAPDSTEVRVSGGFRIEISPDELVVSEARSTEASFAIYLTYGVLFLFILYKLVLTNRFLPFFALLLAIVVRYLFVGIHNLRCTRETLEVIDIFHGRAKQTKFYTRSEVKTIRFGAVSYSKYGGIGGLIFEAAGKRIKTLYGLKCAEAQDILDELQRLGFDVYRDPGMPMMVEMELSRRKSRLAFLFR